MTDQSAGYVPLAAVERNGFDEGVHFGRLVALDADGSRLSPSATWTRPCTRAAPTS